MNGTKTDVIDEDTNDEVGEVLLERGGNRTISLFGGKYKWTCDTHDKAVGFIKGVEAVLTYINE
jgi:hypothetical protein